MLEDARVKFLQYPSIFLENLLTHVSPEVIAEEGNISLRTLRSWKSGETSIPLSVVEYWAKKYSITIPPYEKISLKDIRLKASFKGGKARQEKWGDVGTPEGRKLGGSHSIQSHKLKENSPFVSRAIKVPELTNELAELVGIILGDGGITQYQFVISSSAKVDVEYSTYISKLIESLFNVSPSTVVRLEESLIKTICSRKRVVEYLLSIGLGQGNKVARQVSVPEWIRQNKSFSEHCLKALVDTDGCIYTDKHLVKGRQYSSLGISFRNASIPLLDFVERTLLSWGYHPTRAWRDVRLRRREDVLRYAKEIGFSNPKHARKIGL